MVGQLRLWSGLVLFVFVLGHFINHALGLVSFAAMDAGLPWTIEPWRTLPGTVLLAGALTVHAALALWSLYQRRTLKMRTSDAAQLVLGLLIPLILAAHIFATRGLYEVYDIDGDYPFEIVSLWLFFPLYGVLNALGLLAVWIHACLGWHYWLRLKPWYPGWQPYALALAVLVPTLALAGYVSAGFRALARADDEAWIGGILAGLGVKPEIISAYIFGNEEIAQITILAVILATIMARQVRQLVRERGGIARLDYRDPWFQADRSVRIRNGHSVLELLRSAGISHASVCGGRGRCSTCRVRVGTGGERLPPLTANETRVLERISAPHGVRLACQIHPTASLEVTPLFPPTTSARDGRHHQRHLAGEEREIAVLFADMRAFTELAENRLPYDVVFVLNRYFAAMGQAVEDAGGRIDKFIGDGVMALFGVDGGIEQGCRQALLCARLMAERIDRLNEALAGDLDRPLRIGIGIHAGPVIVGEMGYAEASHLTAVGDIVNTASRLEALTKEFGAQLVVSEDVARRSGLDFAHFPVEQADIRGRADTLQVHIVAAARDLPADAAAASRALGRR